MKLRSIFAGFAVSLLFSAISHSQITSVPRESTPAIRAIEATHYTNYMGGFPSLESLATSPRNANKSEIVTGRTVEPHERIGGASTYSYAWLQGLAANADVVVIGRPYNRISDFIPDHSFIFSDYEFHVENVLKGDPNTLWAGSQIVVTRPGGVINVNGKTFRAIESEFHLFQTHQRYLLFLHRLPDTGTYLATAQDSFLLQDGLVSSAKTHPRHMKESMREIELMSELHSIFAKFMVQR